MAKKKKSKSSFSSASAVTNEAQDTENTSTDTPTVEATETTTTNDTDEITENAPPQQQQESDPPLINHSSDNNVDHQQVVEQSEQVVVEEDKDLSTNQQTTTTAITDAAENHQQESTTITEEIVPNHQEETLPSETQQDSISVNNSPSSSVVLCVDDATSLTTTSVEKSSSPPPPNNNNEIENTTTTLKLLSDTIQQHCTVMSDEFTSFTEKFTQKIQNCEANIFKSKENTVKLSSAILLQKKQSSQKGTLLDPSVQQMIMGFMTQIDQLYEQRDLAITEKMSQMGTNLQKISKTVKVYENVKKKEKDHPGIIGEQNSSTTDSSSTTTQEASSNAQPSSGGDNKVVDNNNSPSNVDANISDDEIRKKCAEFEKLYKDKESELNSFKTKVADWKEKVKVISNKDMKKIEELKKQVSTMEKTIEDMNSKKSEEGNKVLEITTTLQQELKSKDESIERLNKEIEEMKLKLSHNDKQLKASDELISNQKKTIEEKDKLYMDLCETVKNTPPPTPPSTTTIIAAAEPVKKLYKDIKILEKIVIDGSLWCYFQYKLPEEDNKNTSMVLEWMQHDSLREVYSSQQQQQQGQTELTFETLLPTKSIIEKLEENFQTKLSELTSKYDEQVKLLSERDEELKVYKTRAHAALKKKTDALNQAKIDYENQISQLNESLTKKQEEFDESTKLAQDLQDQVQGFLEIQEKAVKLGGELDRVNSEKDDLEDRIRSLEKKIERSKEEFNQEKANLIQEHEASVKVIESKNDEIDDQFRKELRVSRERSRRILDEKEREITKLQMKISESKQQFEEAETVKEKNVSLENEINMLREENQSLRNQITDMMNNSGLDSSSSSASTSRTPRKMDQSQILQNALSLEEFSTTTTTPSKPVVEHENQVEEEPSPTASTPALEREFNQLVELANIQAARDNELNHYKETIKKLKDIIKDRESSEKSFRELEKQLKEQIEHLHRLQKKGDPNLEYLKNILYSFLTSDEKIVRERLLKVIGQLLDLKDEEMDKIAQKLFVETSPSIWGIFGNKK